MHTVTRFACLICLSLLALPAWTAPPAQTGAASPAGTWQQVDDDTGKVTSIIRIDIADGTLTGTVLDVMNMAPETIARDGNPPICTQCEGKRHNQPIEGMVIMWGLHKDGDEWKGGHVLDPKSGKTYKVKLHLIDHGKKLKLRGYVGISLFGRTQVWRRVADTD